MFTNYNVHISWRNSLHRKDLLKNKVFSPADQKLERIYMLASTAFKAHFNICHLRKYTGKSFSISSLNNTMHNLNYDCH